MLVFTLVMGWKLEGWGFAENVSPLETEIDQHNHFFKTSKKKAGWTMSDEVSTTCILHRKMTFSKFVLMCRWKLTINLIFGCVSCLRSKNLEIISMWDELLSRYVTDLAQKKFFELCLWQSVKKFKWRKHHVGPKT